MFINLVRLNKTTAYNHGNQEYSLGSFVRGLPLVGRPNLLVLLDTRIHNHYRVVFYPGNGEILLESRLGYGTKITILLPTYDKV